MLEGEDDAIYFPLTDKQNFESDTEADSESESFKRIDGVSIDHVLTLARRKSGSSAASPHSDKKKKKSKAR